MRTKFDLSRLPPRPNLDLERPLWSSGIPLIGGIDEAGRGAWAGPVAAAVVVLPCDPEIANRLSGVDDSKQLTPEQRAYWAEKIKSAALEWGVGLASQAEIDRDGILPATHRAARRAIEQLSHVPEHLLTDFLQLAEIKIPQTALVKGDARSLSIAAASILAKTTRDRLMIEYEANYPGYGFAAHKGYGTAAHRLAIEQLGPCPLHRMSFAPLARLTVPGK